MTPVNPALPPNYDASPWADHTEFSDPGRNTSRILQVSPDLEDLSAMSRNLVVHYRASGAKITDDTAADINSRWVSTILERDRTRSGRMPLAEVRAEGNRVQGCCRDHSLLAVTVLRSHGIPARIRYGYANYLIKGFGVDHTIVEVWNEDERRWQRFDPEVVTPTGELTTPSDHPVGPGAPFKTAAEVWMGWRSGALDPNDYGVRPGGPERGPWMIQTSVIRDGAFRARQEPLLWDMWGAMAGAGGPSEEQIALADRIAAMTVAADGGDVAEEQRMLALYQRDPRVRLPAVVSTHTPGQGRTVSDLTVGPAWN